MNEFQGFFQAAYVVEDLDAAIQRWRTTLGAGPFFVRDGVRLDAAADSGDAVSIELRVALCQLGSMQLEIIQQTNDVPSAYRDCRPPCETLVHHLGGLTAAFDGDVARFRRDGFSIVALGQSSGVRFAYVDTRSTIGCLTELIDERTSEALLRRFKEVADAATDWDGEEPIRNG